MPDDGHPRQDFPPDSSLNNPQCSLRKYPTVSYANAEEEIVEGMKRLKEFLVELC